MEHKELLRPALPLLIDWCRENRKKLPWRENVTPYRVWVSEIMLQQTRIEAVIPYYTRFLQRLPDVEALAQVPDDELMKLWEGLGYYSRARNLKKAAIQVMERHGGQLPCTAAELRALPGIGDYTAGAIASIACQQPEPAVDGNVMRVLSRLTAASDDVMEMKTRKQMAQALREEYPEGPEAALLTEGLMELGEVLCIPNGKPLCSLCPWEKLCLAHRAGLEETLPVRSGKKERRREKLTVLLLEWDGKYALSRRPDNGLLAGLWQFPNLPGYCDKEQILQAAEAMGLKPEIIRPMGKGKHIFTHVEWQMTGFHIVCGEESRPDKSLAWYSPEEIVTQVPLPTAFRSWREKIQAKSN